MPQFGINFREFFSRYFADHDDTFLSNLGEMISEDADPREIAALADWHFRNYIIEAVTIAMQLNNEKIYNDITALLEERKYREPAQYRTPEEHESISRPFPTNLDSPTRPFQNLPIPGSAQGRRVDEPSAFMGIGPQRGFEVPSQLKSQMPEYDEASRFNAIPEIRGLRDMRKMADSGGLSEPEEDSLRQSDGSNAEE